MKKITILTLMFFTAAFFSQSLKAQAEAQKIELCSKVAGNVTFLSSYTVQLPAARDGERPPNFKQATALRKGNVYRLTICTDEESTGEAVLQVFDEGKPLGSTYDPRTGKSYQSFDIECTKTAGYVIIITYKDGKEGSAVAILSHVKTM